MANYRQIHTRIWKDTWFIGLKHEEKFLFIYLFSNEQANLSGLYELHMSIIAFETGLDLVTVDQAFQTFSRDGKAHYDHGWIWVPNLMKYNTGNLNSPKIRQSVQTSIDQTPDIPFKAQCIRVYNELVDPEYRIDTVTIPYPELESVQEQEHEQEIEQEQEEILSAAKAADTPSPDFDPENPHPPIKHGGNGQKPLFPADIGSSTPHMPKDTPSPPSQDKGVPSTTSPPPASNKSPGAKSRSPAQDYQALREKWAALFPEKWQPRPDTTSHLQKVKTRMQSTHFRENWEAALERASTSTWLHEQAWFQFGWFVKNDQNYEKCLSGAYDKGYGTPPQKDKTADVIARRKIMTWEEYEAWAEANPQPDDQPAPPHYPDRLPID